ncbi:hypothetical protein ENSA5_09430 [Enhygromyxa salina]|uniref:RNA polymerase sigma factor n=1 Tax=Enhygromyxa salina TaxID=215803 RepID=A0A2S9YGR2_9BACT|nr:sigma-70 family RNA polymerase sigma factor [Enhygromyxa salina]PRQ04294.1 hypothetical protein ENSA5_09430 [Enhygromyxa salina]
MDRAQIRAAREGDREARNAVGRWLSAELSAYLRTRRLRLGALDEILQRTMEDIVVKFEAQAPEEPEAVLSWALSFAGMELRAARGELAREAAREAKLRRRAHASPPMSAPAAVLEATQLNILRECIARLDPIYRSAINNYLEGGDSKALAQRDGIPEGTARRRLWAGKKQLERIYRESRRTRTPFRTPSP